MIWYELTRWAAYRSINHAAIRAYAHTLPLCLAVVISIVYWLLPNKPPLTASGGVLASVLTLVAALPGFFFIAALAAVATFNRPEMDEEMPEPCPTVSIYRLGSWISVNLTRRIFLTYLFSYLTVLSLIASSLCIGGQIVGPSLVGALRTWSDGAIKSIVLEGSFVMFVFSLVYVCCAIFVTTLHGIYFIAERIHQPH